MHTNRYYITISGLSGLSLGLGLGLAAGLFIAQKKFEAKYADISTKEIAEAKQFYSILNKKEKFQTPESTIKNLGLNSAVDAIQSYQGDTTESVPSNKNKEIRYHRPNKTVETVAVGKTIAERNIFLDSKPIDENFDYDTEVKNRKSDVPYVISSEEFLHADADYDQVSFLYFEGDDTLVDEKDDVVPDSEAAVGYENLKRFGHGSGDPHIVYIRNEKIELDIEIARSKGTYVEEMLGEIKHSDNHPKIRRFRGDDG